MITVCAKRDKVLRWVVAAMVAAALHLPAPRAAAVEIPEQPAQQATSVSSEKVKAAAQKGVAYLRQAQGAGGRWTRAGYRGGTTALSLLAMLNAGVSAKDPAVQRGLAAVAEIPNKQTYVVSLKCQALAAAREGLTPAERKDVDRQLRAAAKWLCESQLKNGMWTYGRGRGRGDNSNTQFALLGLHEAAKAGVKIPSQVWLRSGKHFTNTQGRDGSWAYTGRGGKGYGSMTAAGVASLFISGQRLHVGGSRRFVVGRYIDCGKYKQSLPLAAGLNWLKDNFSVTQNPGRRSSWLYYYLYALERVGMISGRQSFGKHDWYREGAAFLVAKQRPDGSWGRSSIDTAFALLFLAKGNRPVLIQKVQWKGHWNRNLHDLENMTVFIGKKFGKNTTWQTTSLDVPLKQLRMSPILFITGHEFPRFTKDEQEKLRKYIESGGTLLFDACCGSVAFRKGFEKFAKKFMPEYCIRKLPASHPVFRSYYKMDDTYGLRGIDVGCRTSVFFSPRALSCLWELRNVPKLSELTFKLGTNIAAYATGREQLPDKLDVVELPVQSKTTQPAEVPRGAVRIARLIHDGDYNSDPHCMVNLAALLRDKAKVDVVAKARHLRASDEKIFDYPMLFMHGHFSFKLSDEEIKGLRLYLRKGGCLIADSCCGRKAFDASFRKMVGKLFPKNPLKLLPADHPIYTGKVGLALGEVQYRKILADELKSRGTKRPPLEAVSLKGRTVIIYSKYDWSCALEGDRPYSCRGYADADGRKLAMNIFLYAISY